MAELPRIARDPAVPSDLNADPGVRVLVDTRTMGWEPSPSPSVVRKRLHRSGPAESGRVTSIVRYAANSRFPAHAHPDGEEILVLSGIFSDEHGDWPAGTYLLNPEGHRHAPFSREGCTLFVKLRQYPGGDRAKVALACDSVAWEPGQVSGVDVQRLYVQEGYTDTTAIERWQGGTACTRTWPAGVELLILSGSLQVDEDTLGLHCWLRLPAATRARMYCSQPCIVYVREGALRYVSGPGRQVQTK